MPGTPDMTTDEMVRDLYTRFTRVERAIMGEPSVGHLGLVNRVDRLESADKEATEAHTVIEQNRRDGDKRAHDRIDQVETDTYSRLNSIERKLDRAIWLSIGAFVGGGAIAGGSVWAVLGG